MSPIVAKCAQRGAGALDVLGGLANVERLWPRWHDARQASEVAAVAADAWRRAIVLVRPETVPSLARTILAD
jgi:hypothetical protein